MRGRWHPGAGCRLKVVPLVNEVTVRIDRRAVHAHLVMQVRAGGASGGTDGTEGLAATDALPLAHVERGEMPVERVHLGAVVDDHEPAVAGIASGEDHLAV